MSSAINKPLLLLFIPLLMYKSASAQLDSASSFLSKLYFPFDFGYTISGEKNISNGGLIKTGLEYRLNKNNGLFVRFNFDNRSNQFKISDNLLTNVAEGQIKFNDYVIGLGYRSRGNKVKGFGLFQGGISTYNFPMIIKAVNDFAVKEKQGTTPVYKLSLGLEYYVAKNAALTMETVYILQTANSVFWNNSFSTFGISIGLTTTLF